MHMAEVRPQLHRQKASTQKTAAPFPSVTALLSTPGASDAKQAKIANFNMRAPPARAVTLSSTLVPQGPVQIRNKSPQPRCQRPPANETLPTPVNPSRLSDHLARIGYDPALTSYLVDGFSCGFSIGHNSDIDISNDCSNPRRAIKSQSVVMDKLHKELKAGRVAGPFDLPPFEPFHISPLNIREKKTPGKFRLLHNLSYPYDETSINANIPQNEKTVSYSTVGAAIRCLLSLPRGAFTAKTDIADAFRLIPVNPRDYPKLGMKFLGQYYYDRCLPMGCGSSCKIYETFSTALQAIFESFDSTIRCVHMIDDFFIMAADRATCERHLRLFLAMCADMGIPIAPEKTTLPAQDTSFLGVELDTVKHIARLPPEKLAEYSTMIEDMLPHNKVRRNELESLVGKLNFAASVVPARPFLRRLIDLVWTVDKPYYFIRLTQQAKADLQTWLSFLQSYNGITYFRSLNIVDSRAIHLASDASKLGFGACYGSKWVQAAFPPTWHGRNIAFLELYPVFVLLYMFGGSMANSTIIFHCDNEAVTVILNKQSSKDSSLMSIVRQLVLLLVKHNIHLTSKHIPGLMNILPDRISRFQVTPHLLSQYGMEPVATPIPVQVLPGNFKLN